MFIFHSALYNKNAIENIISSSKEKEIYNENVVYIVMKNWLWCVEWLVGLFKEK